MIKKIVLVDGSSYMYRAFHAMPNLMNSKGESTGAVYGIVNMLRRLHQEHADANFSIVFDAPAQPSEMHFIPNTRPTGHQCRKNCGDKLRRYIA